jgi:hypothetical protein
VSQARFLEEAEAEFLDDVQYCADVQASGAERFRTTIVQAPGVLDVSRTLTLVRQPSSSCGGTISP